MSGVELAAAGSALGTTAAVTAPVATGLGIGTAMGLSASGAKVAAANAVANTAAASAAGNYAGTQLVAAGMNPMQIGALGKEAMAYNPAFVNPFTASIHGTPATSPFMQGMQTFGNQLNNPVLRLAQSLNAEQPQDRMEVRSMNTQPQSANFFRDNQNAMTLQTVPAGRGRLDDEMTLFGRGLL
tara:strand:+ start:5151 stop:5702 length:552 start_codon:yes stop_codon:yes gene_type:complete